MSRVGEMIRAAVPFVATTAAGFALAYAALFVWLPTGDAAETVRVPDIVGTPLDSARRALEGLGYAVRVNVPVAHATIPEGYVMAQAPAAGTAEPVGAAVSLTVSAGNRRTTVPALLGMPQEDATRALERVGLQVAGLEERASALARGTVLDARPVPGALVAVPGGVTLILSGGPAEVVVPDVLGQDLSAARVQLEQLGLVADSAGAEPLAGAAAGSVISQAPVAGARIPNGTKVRLTVATP
jgi:eukaryotic-like serine/threonine-protein kinase